MLVGFGTFSVTLELIKLCSCIYAFVLFMRSIFLAPTGALVLFMRNILLAPTEALGMEIHIFKIVYMFTCLPLGSG